MNIIYLLFPLIFHFSLIDSLFIKIPFEVQNYQLKEEGTVASKYIVKDIIIYLIVGNPTQNIKLSVTFGEYSTFIVPAKAKGYEGGTYNNNISNTYKSLSNKTENYYFNIYKKGLSSTENFVIESMNTKIEIRELEFLLATEIKKNSCHQSFCQILSQTGILGLLLAQSKTLPENISNFNFINQLKSKNLISSYDFSLEFTSEKKGNLIIGAKPDEYNNKKYLKENYIFSKISVFNDDLDWSLSFDHIYYGEETIPNDRPLLFRIEIGYIIVNNDWKKIIYNDFFWELIEQKQCFQESTLHFGSTAYLYYCNKSVDITKFKPIKLQINSFNYDFLLTKDDLFFDAGDKYIFLMGFGIGDLLFGFPFLKKYQLIFNQDLKTIGYYSKIEQVIEDNNNNESESKIPLYLVIIFLGLILIFLIVFGVIYYLKKFKSNKKNATELSNNDIQERKEDKNSLINDEEGD